MAKKPARPSWFKMFLHQKPLLDAMPDETVGKAMKAVFQYFEAGELPELDPMAFAVFAAIRPYVDESFEDFERASEKNRKNVAARWKKEAVEEKNNGIDGKVSVPSDTTGTNGINLSPMMPCVATDTEAETDAEADVSVKGKKSENAHNEVKGCSPRENNIPQDLAELLDSLPSEQQEALNRGYASLQRQGYNHEGAMIQIMKSVRRKVQGE